MTKIGVLLINLGTPDGCDTASVRRYLTQFLNDPRVVDLPALARWLLVNCIIVPLRAKKSAQAYQQIWTKAGSPLLVNSKKLQDQVAIQLGERYLVELGMRYGNPSIPDAIQRLHGCSKLIVLPLFPQYSAAATGSALELTMQTLEKNWNIPDIIIKHDFYNHPDFITAFAHNIRTAIANKQIDTVLFSYHGLPERHISKSECHANCDHGQACPLISDTNQFCYRAQCFETSRLLAASLNLSTEHYQVSFQSRLGKTPWIKPYTDFVLPELIRHGKKNIAIVCPSFVADCLETLEEINIRARAQWQALGGNNVVFVPCLNDSPLWVQAITKLIQQYNQ